MCVQMPVDEQEYVDSFKPHIMEAVYSWCKGAKFSAVLEMTDGVFEGSLIRAMRRLEELLSQVRSQALRNVQYCKGSDAHWSTQKHLVLEGFLSQVRSPLVSPKKVLTPLGAQALYKVNYCKASDVCCIT